MRVATLLFCFLILVNVLYALSGVLNFPMRSVDVYSNWMLKSKVLYLSDGFPIEFFRNWEHMAAHMQYPLLLPFLFSLVHVLNGRINETGVLLFYPVIYLGVVIVMFKTLCHQFPVRTAMVLTYIFSMFSPLLAQGGRVHAGNADIVLTLLSSVALYLLVNQTYRKWTLLYLCLITALASQIKLEGAFLAAIILFFPGTIKKNIPYVVASVVPALVWVNVVKLYHFAADIRYGVPPFLEILHRAWIVATGIIQEWLNYKNWYVFWPLFLLALFSGFPRDKIIRKTIAPALTLMFALYISAYLFAFFTQGPEINIQRYVSSSIDRVFLQLLPWIFYILAVMLFGSTATPTAFPKQPVTSSKP